MLTGFLWFLWLWIVKLNITTQRKKLSLRCHCYHWIYRFKWSRGKTQDSLLLIRNRMHRLTENISSIIPVFADQVELLTLLAKKVEI